MKLIIAGSRSIKSLSIVTQAMVQSPWEPYDIDEVHHGGADGVDRCADTWAETHGLPVVVHRPEWDEYGRAAGPIRNKEMAMECDALVAVWDGESRGTRSMIEKALNYGLPMYVHVVEP